jgi:hypothetical protein
MSTANKGATTLSSKHRDGEWMLGRPTCYGRQRGGRLLCAANAVPKPPSSLVCFPGLVTNFAFSSTLTHSS